MADIDVRPLDPADRPSLEQWQQVYVASQRAENPAAAVFSLDEGLALMQPGGSWTLRPYAVFADDQMVGSGAVVTSDIEQTDLATLFVDVAPEARRRGVGSALVRALCEAAADTGRTTVEARISLLSRDLDSHEYARFARRHDFRVGLVETERRQALPVSAGLLDECRAEAADHHRGYMVEVLEGPVPEALAASYCRTHNQVFADAPSGDLPAEEGRRTPAVLAEQDSSLVERGATRVTAVALLDGGVVAFACAIVQGDPSEPVKQWATVVQREHRGHRLGLAVKIGLTERLQTRWPERPCVVTTNAETNDHMVAINERLGFEVAGVRATVWRELGREA